MINELAGKQAPKEILEEIDALLKSYYTNKPDAKEQTQKVTFGTSGHRGSSTKSSFNENHILAITQALCEYRKNAGITGVMHIGIDTHALSTPAQITALQVFLANEVACKIAKKEEYTPTPVLSFTILESNKNTDILNDGVVITPSHNPPSDGGFKYNMPNGGPADTDVTSLIENRANQILQNDLVDVKLISKDEIFNSSFLEVCDFITPYVKALDTIIDMDIIKEANLKIGVDPLGGSGLEVYKKIQEIYGIKLDIVNEKIDPTFSFMSCDHDGKIRMDCSSKYAMASLIKLAKEYDIAFANDPDFDRHGIVTKSVGLMNPNHYLSVVIWYLFSSRNWGEDLGIGKTLVSSSMIDKVVNSLDKKLYEVPVGFKWFVDGLYKGTLAFGGEESAGASFLRKDGSVWSTDKDGIILNLLAAEMTSKLKRDPGEIYQEFEEEFGKSYYRRVDAPASFEQKAKLKNLSVEDITSKTLANEEIENIYTNASGNNASIGGLKVTTKNGWFAARPSGTEDIYKIYAESFINEEHLELLIKEAQALVSKSIEN
ncbi:phosphoglucomutase (alpha-D-glucose-1,6-bisphosphate-dependent) [Poseidonibacter ostreae]|uniref:Alpha-D-glucose phosphate-specific phosphoglucomutase n=1 Tax=Poseidonibacter ostreae TaxID=2654171 RepID=A0A6L4WPP6_9BACT|nr:phosphoglucomutase (alpha-D-glucose-1,6-bisphosphate-dependent) [Poseidonibacter ostreae]KAB7886217.1 alpha-D-glucose phosphate-specific phosphoglucomutase [Poseidonibacter ostreae]KAB7886944.1 alpha-D-glucose phosphate-specific phosphoglucomutase [Poseidonibacter ostreae]KAB7892237.1 alpha-D-glucose phosphate-specific phosphoglucomutase [Poseidonibacter ostreae]